MSTHPPKPATLKIKWATHGEGRRRGRAASLRAEFRVNRDWGTDRDKWVADCEPFAGSKGVFGEKLVASLGGQKFESADAAKEACEILAAALLVAQKASDKAADERQKIAKGKHDARVAKLSATYESAACAAPGCGSSVGMVPKHDPPLKVYCDVYCALRCEVPE